MAARNESQLTGQIVRDVKAQHPDAWVLKTHGDAYQRAGVPDLLIAKNGRLLAAEIKHQKPGESIDHLWTRVSPRQRFELNNLQRAGVLSIVAWTSEQVLAALEELGRLPGEPHSRLVFD